MTRFLALTTKEIRLLLRDWHGLAVLFLMPALFILIMAMALQNAFNQRGEGLIALQLYDPSPSVGSRYIADKLRENDALRLEIQTDPPATELPNGSLILQLMPELDERLLDPADDQPPATLQIAADVPDQIKQNLELAIRGLLLRRRGELLMQALMENGALADSGFDQADIDQLFDPEQIALPVSRGVASDSAELNANQQATPAWLVFAMFFVTIPLANTFIIERQQGSLLRLRAARVSSVTLFASKLLPYYVINLIQMLLMLAIGMFVVPLLGGDTLHLGHSPLGLWLIGSATSFAAISLALLIAVIASTSMQATAISGVLNIIFAALGGIMVPKLIMPETMQSLAKISPMNWSLEGFWDIMLRAGNWQSVLPETAALAGIGLILLAIAALTFNLKRHN